MKKILFIHGWSVTDTATYGELPARLARELNMDVQMIHLGRYISFRDEVRIPDIARALEAAVQREVKLQPGERFAVITHSTGGLVVRTWWQRFYKEKDRACPMSHVIHLAAAQFGSALAQLGKGTLSRMKGFFQGVEPGVGVLNGLELGSPETWDLNQTWIRTKGAVAGSDPVFSFCLTGQQIDRKFYDNLNSYTGEPGSDGVVRAAATNLNAASLRLEQQHPTPSQLSSGAPSALKMSAEGVLESDRVPFALVAGSSHSGTSMGIMGSVKNNTKPHPVVALIRKCLAIKDAAEYQALAAEFDQHSRDVLEAERSELEDRLLLQDRYFLHDAHSMVIIRVRDDQGYIPDDVRILFTGEGNNPNHLPTGFLVDHQRNRLHRGTFTFYFNHDIIHGCDAVYHQKGTRRVKVRPKLGGIKELGIQIQAFPDNGFARYHPCEAKPSKDLLRRLILPHRTLLLEVVLKRIIHQGVFEISPGTQTQDFKKAPPGPVLGA